MRKIHVLILEMTYAESILINYAVYERDALLSISKKRNKKLRKLFFNWHSYSSRNKRLFFELKMRMLIKNNFLSLPAYFLLYFSISLKKEEVYELYKKKFLILFKVEAKFANYNKFFNWLALFRLTQFFVSSYDYVVSVYYFKSCMH